MRLSTELVVTPSLLGGVSGGVVGLFGLVVGVVRVLVLPQGVSEVRHHADSVVAALGEAEVVRCERTSCGSADGQGDLAGGGCDGLLDLPVGTNDELGSGLLEDDDLGVLGVLSHGFPFYGVNGCQYTLCYSCDFQ